jgi:hypothetical protein
MLHAKGHALGSSLYRMYATGHVWDALAESAARDLTVGLIAERIDVIVSHPDVDVVQVEVQYSAPLLTRMIVEAVGGAGSVELSSVATMMSEG